MCGLTAILSFRNRPDSPAVTEKEIDDSLEIVKHRGPDARGQWISPDGRVGKSVVVLIISGQADCSSRTRPRPPLDHRPQPGRQPALPRPAERRPRHRQRRAVRPRALPRRPVLGIRLPGPQRLRDRPRAVPPLRLVVRVSPPRGIRPRAVGRQTPGLPRCSRPVWHQVALLYVRGWQAAGCDGDEVVFGAGVATRVVCPVAYGWWMAVR